MPYDPSAIIFQPPPPLLRSRSRLPLSKNLKPHSLPWPQSLERPPSSSNYHSISPSPTAYSNLSTSPPSITQQPWPAQQRSSTLQPCDQQTLRPYQSLPLSSCPSPRPISSQRSLLPAGRDTHTDPLGRALRQSYRRQPHPCSQPLSGHPSPLQTARPSQTCNPLLHQPATPYISLRPVLTAPQQPRCDSRKPPALAPNRAESAAQNNSSTSPISPLHHPRSTSLCRPLPQRLKKSITLQPRLLSL